MAAKKRFWMKLTLFPVAGLLLLAQPLWAGLDAADLEKEKGVAVLPFVTLGQETPTWLAEGISAYLRHNLQGLQGALVLSALEVEESLQRCQISLTEKVEKEKLNQFRRVTSADFMVLGAVRVKDNKLVLKLRALSLNEKIPGQELEVKGTLGTLNLLLQEATAQIASACHIEVTQEDKAWMVAPPDIKPTSLRSFCEARAYARQRDFGNADKIYKTVCDQHPRFSEGFREWAAVLWAQRRTEDAEKVLKKALAENPRSVEIPLMLAEIHLEQGKMDEAKGLLDSILLSHPREPHALLVLAQVYQQKGFRELAREALQKGIARSARKEQNALLLAAIDQEKGNLADALRMTEEALEAYPEHPEALRKKAILLGMLGQYDQAIEIFSRVGMRDKAQINGAPQKEEAAAPANSQPQNAMIQQYLEALRKDPTDVAAYNALASAYEQEGKWEEAVQAYRSAIKINPTFAPAYFNLGVALTRQNILEEARDHFKKAIELNPRYREAYENLGNLYWKMGQGKAAIQTWEKAKEFQPSDLTLTDKLAAIYAQQGNWKKVVQTYEDWERASGHAGQAALKIGQTYLRQSHPKKALGYFNQSLKTAPESPAIYKELASFYEARGKNPKKALEYYEIYLAKETDLESKKSVEERFLKLKENFAQKK